MKEAQVTNEDQFFEAADSCLGKPCIICHAPADVVGILDCGDDSQEYGAAAGKTRIIYHPICRRCLEIPNSLEMARGIIYAQANFLF